MLPDPPRSTAVRWSTLLVLLLLPVVGWAHGVADDDKAFLEGNTGMQLAAALKAGDGLVFRWTASADVAVDMHGEAAGGEGTWTSYAVEGAQREAAGTFLASFDGSHGWYWQNRGTEPVTVEIVVTGFQPTLYRP